MSIEMSRILMEILGKGFAWKIFYQKAFLDNLNGNCRAGILSEFWFEFEINVSLRNPLFIVCLHLFHEASEGVKEDSMATDFVARNNLQYQF